MRAPAKGAVGACRRNRRRQRGPEWVRPYRRAQRALDSSIGLLFSTMDAAIASEQRAKRRPVRTAQRLNKAVRQVTVASLRLFEARRRLAEASECLERAPQHQSGEAPELLEWAADRCETVAKYLQVAFTDVVVVQLEVLEGLFTGELVPEHPSDRRPRILLKPRPVPVRAFLDARQPRVSDRITPALLRRRRTPRPAEIRVPRPGILGRAPPLSSTCLL